MRLKITIGLAALALFYASWIGMKPFLQRLA